MPVIAVDGSTKVDLTAKWAGVSSNDIYVEIVESAAAGTTFAITQPTGGLLNPVVDGALALIGERWESIIVNCLDAADTTAFDAYSNFGEGRWGALVHKPLVTFTGSTIVDPVAASTISEARKESDRTNCFTVAPGSKNLPLQIAARTAARVAVVADSNPARSYQSQELSGIVAGSDAEQWDYAQRDLAIKRGCFNRRGC